jgi:hypothetical protein
MDGKCHRKNKIVYKITIKTVSNRNENENGIWWQKYREYEQ